MVKRSNKSDKVIVKTEKTVSLVKFELKEGFKPITVNACTECHIVFIWCSNQMCSLGLRKKDSKSPAFIATETKRADKNVDCELLGDILGKCGIPLPDCGNKSYHEVVYYFALDKDQCNKIFRHNLKFSFGETANRKAQFLDSGLGSLIVVIC